MIRKLKPTGVAIAMALIFAVPQLIHAMDLENESGEPSRHEAQVMALPEKYAYKMWLFHEGQVQAETNNTFPSLLHDVQRVIWDILYELTKNPVLEGSLIYKRLSDNQQFTFLIKDLVKEGTLDLSGPVFEGKANSLVMTTDPVRFFQVGGENSNKAVILIVPRSLIKEKIESTTAQFSMIMAKWDEKVAPIGIFWRWGNWDNLQWYEYLTNTLINEINSKNLYDLWKNTPNNTGDDYTNQLICFPTVIKESQNFNIFF